MSSGLKESNEARPALISSIAIFIISSNGRIRTFRMEGRATGLSVFTGDDGGELKSIDPDAEAIGDDREEVGEAMVISNCEGLESRAISAPVWVELSTISVPTGLRGIVSERGSSGKELVVPGIDSEGGTSAACRWGDDDVPAASGVGEPTQ